MGATSFLREKMQPRDEGMAARESKKHCQPSHLRPAKVPSDVRVTVVR